MSSRVIRILTLQPPLQWLQAMPNMHLLRQTLDRELAAGGVDLVILPEVFNGMPADYDRHAAADARQFLSTLARSCGVAVIGGSIDQFEEDGARRNVCVAVDAFGNELGRYAKRVMFADEQHRSSPGASAGVFEIAGARVGVLICADLWEPGNVRHLVDRADLVCVPAKTTVASEGHTEYARGLWHNLALTRAMENGLAVVVSDWAEGRHEAAALVDGKKVLSVHYTSGGASVVDPSKRPDFEALQQRFGHGQAGVIRATLDLDALEAFRAYRRSVGLLPPMA